MRKYFPLLMAILIVFLMFSIHSNPVMAANGPQTAKLLLKNSSGDCGCMDVTPITGNEKNKIVADLVKSDVFKVEKVEAENQGYIWRGADNISVVSFGDSIGVQVPFYTKDGLIEGYAFINGHFAGHQPITQEDL